MIENKIGVINDEVSEDFTEAMRWIAQKRLNYVEIRMVNGKNVSDLTDTELVDVKRQILRHGLKVSALASPLFKCALNSTRPVASGDVFGQKQESVQEHISRLPRLIQMAKQLGTDRIRVFSFWREKEPENYYKEIVSYLREAAAVASEERVTLMLENEMSCNGGTAEEVANIVEKVNSPWLKVVWDPGNEVFANRLPFPNGYAKVRKWVDHVHLKDACKSKNGQIDAVPIGKGQVPWMEQFRQLEQDGYSGLYIIETHYIPYGGSKMEGTQQSLEGLRNLLNS